MLLLQPELPFPPSPGNLPEHPAISGASSVPLGFCTPIAALVSQSGNCPGMCLSPLLGCESGDDGLGLP